MHRKNAQWAYINSSQSGNYEAYIAGPQEASRSITHLRRTNNMRDYSMLPGAGITNPDNYFIKTAPARTLVPV